MINFLEKKAPFEDRHSRELSEGFQSQFTLLIDLIKGEGPGKLVNNAKTNIFP